MSAALLVPPGPVPPLPPAPVVPLVVPVGPLLDPAAPAVDGATFESLEHADKPNVSAVAETSSIGPAFEKRSSSM
jgi:hypothetical protein